MKKFYVAMRIAQPGVEIAGEQIKLGLPKGCIGVCYTFKTKKAGKEFYGKETEFAVVETIK